MWPDLSSRTLKADLKSMRGPVLLRLLLASAAADPELLGCLWA